MLSCPPSQVTVFRAQSSPSTQRYGRGETHRDRAGGPDLHELGIAPPLARLTGGHPPSPVQQMAALIPVAVVPRTVAVIMVAPTDG
jgi:hypothetical protein